MSRVCLIDAHPDPKKDHFCHALANAYEAGATEAGHRVDRVDIASLDFDCLDQVKAFSSPPPEPVRSEREKLASADHVCLVFPLWLGSLPAKARAFFELAACGEFFLAAGENERSWPKMMMKGKSARIIVTMGMPGFVYRWVMDAGALKALERGLLGISGFKPVRHTVFGGVEAASEATRSKWLEKVKALGQGAH